MDKHLPKKIWLAGLGAIARAEHEGDEWLDQLMKDGELFESEKKDDLDQILLNISEKAKDSGNRVKEKFSNIENTFESKVSDTLTKLGMVSKDELKSLQQRLKDIEAQLNKTPE
jgi:poly(hydroxyalkanoate) granule-associated protein